MTSDTTLSQVCIYTYTYTYDLYFILEGRREYHRMEYTILKFFFVFCFWGKKGGFSNVIMFKYYFVLFCTVL